MSDVEFDLAAAMWAIDMSLSALCSILGINFEGLDFDDVTIGMGMFMVAVISGADTEADYYGGAI